MAAFLRARMVMQLTRAARASPAFRPSTIPYSHTLLRAPSISPLLSFDVRHCTTKPTDDTKVETKATTEAEADPVVVEAEAVIEETPFMESTESAAGASEEHVFQAETRQLLDIVAKSLYTDKEVFIRELVSNSSDALEKLRYLQLSQGESTSDLQIKIATDEEGKTFTIQDNGIGMSKEEMQTNLGTIAKSGSKAFIQNLEGQEDKGAASNIIGQFGVGFYSVFMVADKVEVFSKAAGDETGSHWSSEGGGSYEISDAEGVQQGTKIILHLKSDEDSYANGFQVERMLKKYSNFVGSPILLNGKELNTVQAIWSLSKNEVTADQHEEFYKFIAQAWDKPRFHLHYIADAPLAIKSLFYVGQTHMEKWGSSRMEPGVSLYCRKVLIQSKCDKLLPDWLRFVKGVVDCEDLSLNISRETMQDSAMVRKLKGTLTKRLIKLFEEKAKVDKEVFDGFYNEFGHFLKEGICTDWEHKEGIAKLLRYPSSTAPEEGVSLDEYTGRMVPEQDNKIYYLSAPSRTAAEASPYFEVFKERGWEVLFLYHPIDDFVMSNLTQFGDKTLVNAETADLTLKKGEEESEQLGELREWMKEVLGADKVSEIKVSSRLVSSAASLYDHDSAALRHMMRYVDQNRDQALPPQKLEVNASHPIISKLEVLRTANKDMAELVAGQVFDNALISAGLLDEPRSMLPRLNSILENFLEGHAAATTQTTASAAAGATAEEAKET